MKDLLAAQRYAQALFELTRPARLDEAVEAELVALSQALKKEPGIEAFLLNPRLRLEEKKRFLARLYASSGGTSKVLNGFFALLFEKHRFHLVHEIAVAYKKIADEAQGQALAEIKSAAPLSPEQEKALVAKLEKVAGRALTVRKAVDPSLIGGVAVRIGHRVLDGSVRRGLDRLRQELRPTGHV